MQILELISVSRGSIKTLSIELKKLYGNTLNVIVVTTGNLYSLYHAELIKLNFEPGKIKFYFINENTFEKCIDVSNSIISNEYNLVIGFGGGRVLDIAKHASFISKRKYIAVPTALSNDGLVSPISVLKKNGFSKSFGSKSPEGVCIDFNLVSRAPSYLLKSGLADSLSNYSALFDWELAIKRGHESKNALAYYFSDHSFRSLLFISDFSLEDNNPLLESLSYSLITNGLAMYMSGNSRPCSGSEHLFSHSLDLNFPEINLTHGYKVALGTIVSTYFQRQDTQIVFDFLKKHKIQFDFKKIGLSSDVFIEAWIKARETRPDRYTILNEIKLSEYKLLKIYNELLGEYH